MSKQDTDATGTKPAHAGIDDPLSQSGDPGVSASGNEFPGYYFRSTSTRFCLASAYGNSCMAQLADPTIERCPSIPNPLPLSTEAKVETPEIKADVVGLMIYDVRGRKSILLVLQKASENTYVFEGTVEL